MTTYQSATPRSHYHSEVNQIKEYSETESLMNLMFNYHLCINRPKTILALSMCFSPFDHKSFVQGLKDAGNFRHYSYKNKNSTRGESSPVN